MNCEHLKKRMPDARRNPASSRNRVSDCGKSRLYAMRFQVIHYTLRGGVCDYNLGLEPCIGAQDSLADAVTQYNLYAVLPPHGSKNWWLEIELTA